MKTWRTLNKWFKNLSKKKQVLIYVMAALLILSSTAGAITWHRLSNIEARFGEVFNPPPTKPNPNPGEDDTNGMPEIIDIDEAFRDQKILNVLLMGFDRNEARDEIYAVFRPDTLMLAAINLESGKVDIISVPRDSLVPIYRRGGGIDKINHSFYYGWASTRDESLKDERGLEYTIQTVSMALGGVPIHYYATIDMEGVVEAVNIMGGVWYDVPHDVYSNRGTLHLTKGYQKLNGRQFLNYARNRQYVMGDVDRTKVQQNLLIAAFTQFKQANALIKAPQAMLSMRNDINTNLSLEQMLSLALFATNKIDRDSFHQHTLQGRFANGRVWEGQAQSNIYWIINNTKRAALLKEVWGINVKVEPELVLLPAKAKEPVIDDDSDTDPTDPADDDDSPGVGGGDDDDSDDDPGNGDDDDGSDHNPGSGGAGTGDNGGN